MEPGRDGDVRDAEGGPREGGGRRRRKRKRRPPRVMRDGRRCVWCQEELVRKRYPSGSWENNRDFEKRKACDRQCWGEYVKAGLTGKVEDA